MTETTRMDPATRLVRSLPGKYFMVREAAEVLNCSDRTLRRLLKEDPEQLGPSFCTFIGKGKIYLYTLEDIEKLRVHLAGVKRVYRNTDHPRQTGRPQKWNDDQRKARQRLYSASYYYQKRAKYLSDHSDEPGAAAAMAKVAEIKKELDDK